MTYYYKTAFTLRGAKAQAIRDIDSRKKKKRMKMSAVGLSFLAYLEILINFVAHLDVTSVRAMLHVPITLSMKYGPPLFV